MHANQGDHLIVEGKKIGTQSREGEIVEVRGRRRATLRGAMDRRSRRADLPRSRRARPAGEVAADHHLSPTGGLRPTV